MQQRVSVWNVGHSHVWFARMTRGLSVPWNISQSCIGMVGILMTARHDTRKDPNAPCGAGVAEVHGARRGGTILGKSSRAPDITESSVEGRERSARTLANVSSIVFY